MSSSYGRYDTVTDNLIIGRNTSTTKLEKAKQDLKSILNDIEKDDRKKELQRMILENINLISIELKRRASH